jgi:hypothetical protein
LDWAVPVASIVLVGRTHMVGVSVRVAVGITVAVGEAVWVEVAVGTGVGVGLSDGKAQEVTGVVTRITRMIVERSLAVFIFPPMR